MLPTRADQHTNRPLPDFLALMSRHGRRARGPFFAETIQYVVFDMLYFGGRCLMDWPLRDRCALLHERVSGVAFASCCQGVVGDGKAFFEKAIAAGHEGVVAKRLSSRYLPNRRGRAWRKVKQTTDLPCVVIGYRPGPEGVRDLVMATLLEGELSYAGLVELGIHQPQKMRSLLEPLKIRKPVITCSLSARWVQPVLFCTVRICGWRPGGLWRDPVVVAWDE